MGAEWSTATIVVYVVLIAILLATSPRSFNSNLYGANYVLAALFGIFLLRYLSTHYVLDARSLRARRLFGSRSVLLAEVRKIEFGNLRDLSPVSMIGSWGWRGRTWSPTIGAFDSIHTTSRGVLVTAGRVPLFVSPRDPTAFAQELSRRVRSYTGPLAIDAGAPRGEVAPVDAPR